MTDIYLIGHTIFKKPCIREDDLKLVQGTIEKLNIYLNTNVLTQ